MSAIAKRDPSALRRFPGTYPFGPLRQEMESMFENFFGDAGFLAPASDLVPSLDLSETEDAVTVETDLPGFKADEVDIEVNDNYLTISGKHSEEQKEEGNGRKYHRVERRTGTFSRSVLLPCPVNQNAVEAELKDGVLTVTLPKAEEARRQKITVKG